MKISDFLSPADVIIDVRASNKQQLLRDLAHKAAAGLGLPADDVASELLKREDLGSTGIGGGVAIPHTRMNAVKQPFGLLARLKQPIDFDAIDGQAVDIVVLLLLPGAAEADQLGALASVARKLKGRDTLARLRAAKTAADVYAAMVD
jgi:PTS system nitrogen regulatory IIA component